MSGGRQLGASLKCVTLCSAADVLPGLACTHWLRGSHAASKLCTVTADGGGAAGEGLALPSLA